MKIKYILFAFALSFSVFSTLAVEKTTVLIVTGEKKIDREAFFSMFDSFSNIEYSELKHPEVRDILGSEAMPQFDIIVFYDMPARIELSSDQKLRFNSFFASGIKVLFLHHSLVSYQSWNEFQDIIGGKYFENETLIDGKLIKSGYRHNVNYEVKISDQNNPVTKGLQSFHITDEVYNNYMVNNDVVPILTTEHPESGSTIGWINQYGRSSIVYLLNGHDKLAFENPHYRKLVENAIWWLHAKRQ